MSVNTPPGVIPIRNTSTVFIATNPILLYGQAALETDTNRMKSGDGTSTYTQLTYAEWQYEIVEAAGTNTYTGTFSKPYLLAYFPLMRVRVRFANANTGAATINLNGLGAIAIRKAVSTALVAGDILAGGIYELAYDGTNFQVIGGVSASGGTGTVTSVSVVTNQGVSGTVATATTTPAITLTLGALTGITSLNGMVVTANTGAITTATWNASVIGIAYGGTNNSSAYTAGSVIFSNGTSLTQDNTNLFWDDTNNRLGIGTALPTAALHLRAGTATASTAPLKLTSGTNLTAAESGVVEYNGNYYLTNATVRFSTGGVLPFNNFADVPVGGGETDIYSATLLASTFNVNGDKVAAMYGGNFVTVGTEITQLKVKFGPLASETTIWDSTGVAPTTGTTSWRITVELIRVSATVIRYTVSLNTTGASGFVYCTCGELTALTLSNANVLKITGTSSGVGSGVGDIVGKMGSIEFKPST